MIKIIIATHGELCNGLLNSLSMFATFDEVETISLDERGVEVFKENFKSLLIRDDNYLVLTDIAGGTPFNTAFEYKLESQKKIEVLSGVNLPMAIEAVLGRELNDLQALSERCVATANASITHAKIKNGTDSDDE